MGAAGLKDFPPRAGMLSHEAHSQNLPVCVQHDRRWSPLEYDYKKQSKVVVYPGVVAHQLQHRRVVAEQIHQVPPTNFQPHQQHEQRADDAETGQPHNGDYLHQGVWAHKGAVLQRETYGDVPVVRHCTQAQQVQGTVEVNEKSLRSAGRIGDETAPRHDAHEELREESRGPHHVTDGQAEQQDEHGLMQLLAPDNRSEHQQVAGHN